MFMNRVFREIVFVLPHFPLIRGRYMLVEEVFTEFLLFGKVLFLCGWVLVEDYF